MSRLFHRFAFAAAICALVTPVVYGNTTNSQSFTVTVPQSLSITAPVAATLTHDQTDNPLAFPAQSWVVRGNVPTGVNVNFATSSAFTHSQLPEFKRNARLNLVVASSQGPAAWTVTVPEDQTNIATNDGVAQVTATSNGVGRANFNLSVTFLTEEFGVFAAGAYSTTVVGTVAAN